MEECGHTFAHLFAYIDSFWNRLWAIKHSAHTWLHRFLSAIKLIFFVQAKEELVMNSGYEIIFTTCILTKRLNIAIIHANIDVTDRSNVTVVTRIGLDNMHSLSSRTL